MDAHADIAAAFAEPVDPELAIGIDHHLDDGGIAKRLRDHRPHGGFEHGAAALFRCVAHSESSSVFLRERLPPAIWRPTCSMNLWKRSRATASADPSGPGGSRVDR